MIIFLMLIISFFKHITYNSNQDLTLNDLIKMIQF